MIDKLQELKQFASSGMFYEPADIVICADTIVSFDDSKVVEKP